MHLVTATDGWIVAGSGLYWTEDRGCHWRNVTPEPGPQWGADAIFFLDRLHGWVATAQTVFRTTDGGRSWQKIPTAYSTDRVGLQFVDARNGWLASTGFGNGETRPAEPAGAFLHTTDGGLHWTGDVDSRVNGGAVRFVTAADGWALNFANDVPYRSNDGSASWTSVAVPLPIGFDDVRFALPTFSTPSDGVLPATLLRQQQRIAFTFYVTRDRGHSWAPTRVFSTPPSRVIAVVNAKVWMVASGGPTTTNLIDTTSDAGQTWAEIPAVGLPPLAELDFATPLVGWAQPYPDECVGIGQTCSYREHLLVTVDGGKRWTTIDLQAAGL
jgi:photosystem II stability/assembly factor-like uncharacterized protein